MGPLPYVMPVGDVGGDILIFLCQELQDSFAEPCELAPSLPHPSDAYHKRRKRYVASSILRQLGEVTLPQTYRALGVADLDLYVPDLT